MNSLRGSLIASFGKTKDTRVDYRRNFSFGEIAFDVEDFPLWSIYASCTMIYFVFIDRASKEATKAIGFCQLF